MKVRETKRGEMTVYVFRCPGCFLHHALDTRFTLAGDVDEPTFTPEVNLTWGPNRCHFAIAGGAIAFAADSTHALKGKTVELPEIV